MYPQEEPPWASQSRSSTQWPGAAAAASSQHGYPGLPPALAPYPLDPGQSPVGTNMRVPRDRESHQSLMRQGTQTTYFRAMTPVEQKEARMQNLVTQHHERLRRLAFERQQILHAQAMYLGDVDPVNTGSKDAQAAAAERQALIEQLVEEQPAAEAMLESLKQGSSFESAYQVGKSVHEEMTSLRANGRASPAASAPGYSQHHPHQPPALRTVPTTSHAQRAARESAAGSVAAKSTHSHAPSQAPGRAQGGGRQASKVDVQGSGRGRDATHHHPHTVGRSASKSAAPSEYAAESEYGYRDDDDQGGWQPHTTQSTGGGRHQHRGHAAGHAGDTSPAYIQELKSQVEALRGLVEATLQRQPAHASAPQPVIMQMPWYPHPGQVTPPSSNQQGQEGGSSLPSDVLAIDPDMRGIQARHMRDMAVMRMEIERTRTVAELQATRAQLGATAPSSNSGYDLPPPGTSLRPPGSSQPSQGPQQPVFMMDVPGHSRADSSHLNDDDLSTGSEFTDDDDTLADHPDFTLPSTTIRADVLNVHAIKLGPCHVRGSYRLRVVLYDGFQPLYVGPDLVVGASTTRKVLQSVKGTQVVNFNETVSLRGLSLSPTMLLVFEVYVAKQAIAGMPAREDLCAWSYCNAIAHGQVVSGQMSVPLYRLPIMISAQRHFSYNGAMLDISVSHQEGDQGDGVYITDGMTTAGSRQQQQQLGGADPTAAGAAKPGIEDLPGIPCAAFLKVARGTPPAEPFTPGEGFVVVIDAGRFLPANVTISKVVGVVVAPDKKPLTKSFEALAVPDSDAFNPKYGTQTTLAQGLDKFDNAAATLLLTVYTLERWSGAYRVVGYAALPVFLDPRTQDQPASKNLRDYVLNMGAFQIPLHIDLPSGGTSFRSKTLQDGSTRLPCASLLIRVLTLDAAKQQRRQPLPVYSDRTYDSTRALPLPVERPLYSKYLARKPLLVREAARLLTGSRQQGGGMSAGEALPATDPELLDWMEARLRPEAGKSSSLNINYNLASEYFPDLGFYVSVDGAMRLPRNLPSGALVTFAPPGSFYQDNPVIDDMKIVFEPSMTSCLAAPRWLDGWQHFQSVVYEPGLALLIDVRLLVTGAVTSTPAGWAVLPVFERVGQYVASGCYQLPLFQGVPSRNIIQEFANKGDVDSVVIQQLKSKRLKPHEDCCSIFVRIVDASRQGQLEEAITSEAGAAGLQRLRVPAYANELGPRFLSTMRKDVRNKTFSEAKPEQVGVEAWKEQMSLCLCKVAGLEVKTVDDEDEDEEESVV